MKRKPPTPAVTTRLGSTFPPAGLLANHPGDELFDDVADQFEKLEQPMNLQWMQTRKVSLEVLQTLSRKIALVLRGYRALAPRDRIAFVTQGIFVRPTATDKPAETILGQRHDAASNPQPDHEQDEDQNNPTD